jgi:poly(3-hydroxybutyrate) depolymerase
MTAPLLVEEEVAQLLDQLGHGTYRPDSDGGSIFLNLLPEAPDLATAVALYGSSRPGDAGIGYDQPRLQLRCRGTQDPRTGAARAQALYDALVGLRSRHLPGGTWLCLCTPVQAGPVWLRTDEAGRHQYVVNIELLLRRPTAQRN